MNKQKRADVLGSFLFLFVIIIFGVCLSVRKGGSAMNPFIQFVSALAVSILTELFKFWLNRKKVSKKQKERH
jgi:hypothetical protein